MRFVRACLLRLRPILMTTMAALLGALPLMLGSGMGSGAEAPTGLDHGRAAAGRSGADAVHDPCDLSRVLIAWRRFRGNHRRPLPQNRPIDDEPVAHSSNARSPRRC